MPYYKRKSAYNAARKLRRSTKYGKFSKPAGATVRYGYGSKGRGTKKIMVPKFINPFRKDYELVQLKYRDTISLNPTTGTLNSGGSNTWLFSFNSLYDPDVTSVGHQPMYLDNYASLYQRYKVSFAKIKATIVNHSVNTAVWNGSAVATQPNYSYKLLMIRDINPDEVTGQNIETVLEQDAVNTKWRYVAPQLNGRLPSISMKCAPHKTAGVSYDDDSLQSLMTAGPSKNIKGLIGITSADGTTDPPSVNIVVEITYYCKFFDRVTAQAQN